MSLSIPAELLQNTGLSAAFIAHFGLFFVSILVWTLVVGKILNKFLGLPFIAGQIVGGMLLGPSCIDIAHWSFFAQPLTMFDSVSGANYSIISSDLFIFALLLISSTFTVSYLLWLAGHETDLHDMAKVGFIAVTAGVLGAVLPVAMIGGLLLYAVPGYTCSMIEAIGLGLIFSATSVSIPVAMLYAARKMHLKSSKATLGAAVVDDIVAVLFLSLFFLTVQSGFFAGVTQAIESGHRLSIIQSLAYLFFSLLFLMGFGYWIVRPCVRWLSTSHYNYLLAPVATGVMLLYFGFAELFGGLAGITGAYFAGLFHRMGDEQHQAEKVIAPFVNAILLPVFLGSIGLQVNICLLRTFDWVLVCILLFLAIVSKLIACFISTWLSNRCALSAERWTLREGYLFGSAMVARGEVGLVIATILHGSRIITADIYVIAVVVIVLTTIATPIMLAAGFSFFEQIEKEEA
ncbi:MAG: cation:proton antiporter [Candidatus Dependentiae bacterium]|nr:cation:proton antiporter [Candidatus Dependentiae bacterium]